MSIQSATARLDGASSSPSPHRERLRLTVVITGKDKIFSAPALHRGEPSAAKPAWEAVIHPPACSVF